MRISDWSSDVCSSDLNWTKQFRQRRNEALDRDLVEIPGAPDAVRTLYETLDGRIAVASGADIKKVKLQLAKVGLTDCFGERVFSGQDMPRRKRSDEHTSDLPLLMRHSYAVYCL